MPPSKDKKPKKTTLKADKPKHGNESNRDHLKRLLSDFALREGVLPEDLGVS